HSLGLWVLAFAGTTPEWMSPVRAPRAPAQTFMKSLYFSLSSPLVFKCPSGHLGGIDRSRGQHSCEDASMTVVPSHYDPLRLGKRLRSAHDVTRALMLDVIDTACRRFPSLGQTERTMRVSRLIDAEAWADAALALLALELPLWQARRIAYDDGEWYCALSRER